MHKLLLQYLIKLIWRKPKPLQRTHQVYIVYATHDLEVEVRIERLTFLCPFGINYQSCEEICYIS